MVLVTEWSEFRSPDFMEIKERLKNAVIFDGRNQYNAKALAEHGFKYFQIGVKAWSKFYLFLQLACCLFHS